MPTDTAVKTKKFAAPTGVAKKTAAKTATPKVAKAASTEHTARKRTTLSDETTIKIITKEEHPYRVGTKAASSFELLKKSKTFGEYAKLTEKSKLEVYEAGYFAKWASTEHGKAPAFIKLG